MSVLNLIIRATDSASSVINGVSDSVNNLSRSPSIANFGKAFTSAGATLTAGVTLPLIGLGVAASKVAINFEDVMAKVRAITGASGGDIEKLTETAKDLGATTVFSASEAAQAMVYLGQAGWSTDQILQGIPNMLNLASAGGLDLAVAADIAADNMSAFNIKASESGRVADVLAKAANATNTSVEMLGESFKFVAPVAGSLNYSLEETSAMLGILANNGIKAGQGGTALRQIMGSLAAPTQQAADLMREYNIGVYDSENALLPMDRLLSNFGDAFKKLSTSQQTALAKTVVGTEAMSGFLVLINSGPDKLNELTAALENSGGSAEEVGKIMNDTTGGAIREMESAIEGAAIVVGNVLAPHIKKAADYVADLAEKFSKLDKETQETILKTLAFAAAMGPVLLVVGTLVATIAGVASVLNPLGLIVVAILAIIAHIVLMIVYWEEYKLGVKLILDEASADFTKYIDKHISDGDGFGRWLAENLASWAVKYHGWTKDLGDGDSRWASALVSLFGVSKEGYFNFIAAVQEKTASFGAIVFNQLTEPYRLAIEEINRLIDQINSVKVNGKSFKIEMLDEVAIKNTGSEGEKKLGNYYTKSQANGGKMGFDTANIAVNIGPHMLVEMVGQTLFQKLNITTGAGVND